MAYQPPKKGEKSGKIGGSASTCVNYGKMQREHPSAEKFSSRAALHGSLERFQAIDLSFGLTAAPAFFQGVPDGVDIAPQRAHEPLHRVKA